MNPEQFIYWLSGYLSGGRDNDKDFTVEEIQEALKQVKVSATSVFTIGLDNG